MRWHLELMDGLQFRHINWTKALDLAREYGWTRDERSHVMRDIAVALEKALEDIPDTDIMTHCLGFKDARKALPREWFSGEHKQYLRDLIEFCKEITT